MPSRQPQSIELTCLHRRDPSGRAKCLARNSLTSLARTRNRRIHASRRQQWRPHPASAWRHWWATWIPWVYEVIYSSWRIASFWLDGGCGWFCRVEAAWLDVEASWTMYSARDIPSNFQVRAVEQEWTRTSQSRTKVWSSFSRFLCVEPQASRCCALLLWKRSGRCQWWRKYRQCNRRWSKVELFRRWRTLEEGWQLPRRLTTQQ